MCNMYTRMHIMSTKARFQTTNKYMGVVGAQILFNSQVWEYLSLERFQERECWELVQTFHENYTFKYNQHRGLGE